MPNIGLNIKPRSGGGSIPVQAEATAFFSAVAGRGFTIPDTYKDRYNSIYYYAKQLAGYSGLDYLLIPGIFDTDVSEANQKIAVMTDLIDPSRVATFKSDYTGSVASGAGFVGDGANFGVVTEYNPSTALNGTRNDVVVGCLMLAGNSISNHWDYGSTDGGFANFNGLLRAYADTRVLNTAGLGTDTYQIYQADPIGWTRTERISSTVTNDYINGLLTGTHSDASIAISSNKYGLMGAYGGGAWAAGFYTPNTMGCFYAGKASVVIANQLEMIINQYGFRPVGGLAAFDKRIFAAGDSIFSARPDVGDHLRMWKVAVATLADNWLITSAAEVNTTAVNFDTNFSTLCTPYYRSDLTNQVFSISFGTNDLALSSRTAAQCYANLKSIATQAKALGYSKVILHGVIDRNANFSGVTQAQFDTARAALRTLILADTGTSTGVTNVTSGTATDIDLYIDSISNAKFANAADTTYFQVDTVHLNTVGNTAYANELTASALPLFGF